MAEKEKEIEYDFFDGDDVQEETPQQEETPEEREDREIEELVVVNPRDKYRNMVFGVIGGALLLFVAVFSWLFYHPIISEAHATGRLMKVECRGIMFKTYEGEMVSEQYVTDTIKRKSNDFKFSIESDSLSFKMMRLQNKGKKLTVVYKQYHMALPWRGSSVYVATDVIEE